MEIRPATASDAEAIERIRVRGWRVAYRHVFPPEELDAMPIDASRWKAWMSRNDHHDQSCAVAEDSAGLLGWATYGPNAKHGCGELHGLYVDPDRWGDGVGRKLIGYVEAQLGKTWKTAILWTLEDNPRTRRFYEAAGWEFDGATSTLDFFGVSVPIVRYGKRFRSSTS